MHKNYLKQVTNYCMLDVKGKLLAREIYSVLSLVLDFRLLVQCYLINSNGIGSENSDDDMNDDSFDRVGALCVTSPEFYSKFSKFDSEFNSVKQNLSQSMRTIVKAIKVSSTRAGNINSLSQVNTLINFNQFYK